MSHRKIFRLFRARLLATLVDIVQRPALIECEITQNKLTRLLASQIEIILTLAPTPDPVPAKSVPACIHGSSALRSEKEAFDTKGTRCHTARYAVRIDRSRVHLSASGTINCFLMLIFLTPSDEPASRLIEDRRLETTSEFDRCINTIFGVLARGDLSIAVAS
jgi:hypothetical protein